MTTINNFMRFIFFIFSIFTFAACNPGQHKAEAEALSYKHNIRSEDTINYRTVDTATFAGGCFWCMEATFQQIKGVKAVVSGFAGGHTIHPTYDEVSRGGTNFAETVQIFYRPDKIDFRTLLDVYFVSINPTQVDQQGPDIGKQYRSVIFYHNSIQKQEAEDKIRAINESGAYQKPVATKLQPYTKFWPAGNYHQDYIEHHPHDPYVEVVSIPRINKVKKAFPSLFKSKAE